MSYIDIDSIEAACGIYSRLAAELMRMRDDLVESRRNMAEAEQEELVNELDKLIGTTESDIENVKLMADGLREVLDIYKNGVRWLDDVVTGEEYIYPHTDFGVTHLDSLTPYTRLMPFESDIRH